MSSDEPRTLHEASDVLARPWWRFVYWTLDVLTVVCQWAARVLERVTSNGHE